MLHVRLDDLDFSNELLDIIKLFFNEFVMESCDSEDVFDKAAAGLFLHGRIFEYSGKRFYDIRLIQHDSISEEVISEQSLSLDSGIPGKFEHEKRKYFKRNIKRAIFILLSEYSGKKIPWGILTGIRPAKIIHEFMDQGYNKSDIEREMTQYFLLSNEKAKLLYDVGLTEKKILDASPGNSASIYIGIPFCKSKCLYCSFTSYPILKYSSMAGSYLSALKKELYCVSEILRVRNLKVQSIYIGGGTPTSITADELRELLDFVESAIDLSCLQEYTIEAGRPDTIDADKLSVIKNSSVNRISINPQTMNDDTLKLIGRNHTKEDFIKSFLLARDMGFNNINTDVIIGLPGENIRIFEDTLEQISDLGPECLTVHTMAIKRASRLNMEKNVYTMISESEAVRMVEIASDYAIGMQLYPYYLYRQKNMLGNLENVGYCRPGFESIYNIQIMEERQSIFAVGAGAISKVVWRDTDRIERAFNVKDVATYIARIDEMIERKKALFEL